MNRSSASIWVGLGLVLGSFWAAGAAMAAEPLQFIPQEALIYAEIRRPELLLDRALAPEMRALVESTPQWQEYLNSPQFGQTQGILSYIENRTGIKWDEVLRNLAAGGITVAASPQKEAVLIILKTNDAGLAKSYTEAVIDLAKIGGQPVKSGDYNGVMAHTLQEGGLAVVDDLIIFGNMPEVLKFSLDTYQGTHPGRFSDVDAFKQAQSQVASDAFGWVMVRLDAIRENPDVHKALFEKHDNPVAELLFGGILDALKSAPYAMASVHIDNNQVHVSAHVPYDRSQTSESRQWFFAVDANQEAPKPLALPGLMGAITAHRDLEGFWGERATLFDDNTLAGFDQVDTNLGLFLGGQDLETEILSEISPQWQFLVAHNVPAPGAAVPEVQVPAFALVFGMKNPDAFATTPLLAFQTVVGIVNIDGAQNGRPAWLQGTEDYKGVQISVAKLPVIAGDDRPPGIERNFTPACARVQNYFVIGSTTSIVKQVVDAVTEGGGAGTQPSNTAMTVDFLQVAEGLLPNRELLVSRSMLENGSSREEAAHAVDAIFRILRWGKDSRLELAGEAQNLKLDWVIHHADWNELPVILKEALPSLQALQE